VVRERPLAVREFTPAVNSMIPARSRETAVIASIDRANITRDRQRFIDIPPLVPR
jgi:hypothetical protein